MTTLLYAEPIETTSDRLRGPTLMAASPLHQVIQNMTDDGGVLLVVWWRSADLYRGGSPAWGQRVTVSLWQASLADTEHRVGDGSPASASAHLAAVHAIKAMTDLSDERLATLFGVTRQTLSRWRRGFPISDAHRRHLFEVREVLERAAARHPTPDQLVAWLDTPRAADGRTPAQALAAGEVARARLLALASPSPGLAVPPAWVRRPAPAAFQAGAEHLPGASPPSSDDRVADIGRDDADAEPVDGGSAPRP